MPYPILDQISKQDVCAAIAKWMAGRTLSERESAIVDAALRLNAADQFTLCYGRAA